MDKKQSQPKGTAAASGTGKPGAGGQQAQAGQAAQGAQKKKKPIHENIIKGKTEVTNNGLTLKEWQRTPKQLLTEWAQGQQRPKPIYRVVNSDKDSFLVRVILPDPRGNSEKDIVVTPTLHLPSQVEAEHAAALVALKRVDGDRQHDKKLPDPYRTAWLNFDKPTESSSTSGSDTKQDQGNASASAAAQPTMAQTFDCDICGKSFKKEHGLTTHKKKEHPPPKVKLEDGESATDSTGTPGSSVTPPSTSITPPPTAAVAAPSAVPTKPKGISVVDISKLDGLSAKEKYSSKHEGRVQAEAVYREKMVHIRKKEAMQRSNEHTTVFMSQELRNFVELIIKAHHGKQGNDQNGEQEGDISVSNEEKDDLVNSIVELGFSPVDVEDAIYKAKRPVTTSTVLDYLCTYLPEERLPQSFDPRGKQFEVVTKSSSMLDAFLEKNEKEFLSPIDAFQRWAENKRISIGDNFNGDEHRISLLLYLYSKLNIEFETLLNDKVLQDPTGTENDINEEWEAILATLDSSNSASKLEHSATILEQFNIELVKFHLPILSDNINFTPSSSQESGDAENIIRSLKKVSGTTVLEIFVVKGHYPELPAIPLISNKNFPYQIQIEFARKMAELSLQYAGSLSVFLLWQSAHEILPQVFHEHAMKAKKPKQPPKFVLDDVVQPTLKSKDKALKKKQTQGSGKGSKMLNRDNLSLQKKVSEDIFNRHAAKATNQDYIKMQTIRQKLPAHGFRSQIIEASENSNVFLLSGDTGCGKTTQVPQFILEHAIQNKKAGAINIICTQPRRLAAIGVATRVNAEMCESAVGKGLIGYQVRLDSRVSENTRLQFVTTGILLRMIQSDPELKDFTHVIVDEVHERNMDTDFLLALLRNMILTKRPDMKIILMSATMNTEVFVNYFSAKGDKNGAAIVKIPGFTHPVEDFYLPDVIKFTNYRNRGNKQIEGNDADETSINNNDGGEISGNQKESGQLHEFDDDDTNYDLIGEMCNYINQSEKESDGAILVFVSGQAEISRACDAIARSWDKSNGIGPIILPLHGGTPVREQARVFERPPKGKRKIIVSTNVAETSITIEDIVYVVDTGKHKENRYDPNNKMAMLVETWISQASAKQRRGRAGRVRPGKCFKLYSQQRMRQSFPVQQIPEIHRAPLENILLQVMSIGYEKPLQFMLSLVEPPPTDAIHLAIQLLADIGACEFVSFADEETKSLASKSMEGDDTVLLTPLGEHLSQLPMDVRLGKMLIFGSLLKCAKEITTIAAALSTRPMFMNPSSANRSAINSSRVAMFGGANSGQSDHIGVMYAFEKWKNISNSDHERYKFAEENFISHVVCREIDGLREDYANCLEEIGFATNSSVSPANGFYMDSRSIAIVKAAICAGLYPNIIKVQKPIQKYEESAGGAVASTIKAEELRFFALQGLGKGKKNRAHKSHQQSSGPSSSSNSQSQQHQQQVFVHPASLNFNEGDYRFPWLVYREKVQTSKLFVREVTCVNPYSLLLFGGQIEVKHDEGLLIVEGQIPFKAPAKIGVLVKELRHLLRQLLAEKIENPELDISSNPIIEAVTQLITTGGFQ